MNATYSLAEFFKVLDKFAPLNLSHQMIEKGSYDNSGILIKTHDTVKGAIFSLDLNEAVLKRAKALGIDTIVTHHPAIYTPVKSLDISSENASVVKATMDGKNVISMHLNLDVADDGIDMSLANAFGADEFKILDYVDELHGYGRAFKIAPKKLGEFVSFVKKIFGTKKVIFYGNKNAVISSVASFCGGGASHAVSEVEKGLDADVIVTSDVAHHEIKYLLDSGKSLVILPHYVAEEYGFKKFFEKVENVVGRDVKLYYFDDKRFR